MQAGSFRPVSQDLKPHIRSDLCAGTKFGITGGYLAFDLLIGSWQVRNAQVLGISDLIEIPCLALTPVFGPAGLLLYFIVRIAGTRSLENRGIALPIAVRFEPDQGL